jgi:predicted dehydrogenase
MLDKVRVGVIGTSGYAEAAHLPRIRSHARAELAAICGRNRERAEEVAAKHGIPQVFTDYREMIEKGGLHAVVVSTPDDLHYPMTMGALDAGLHVMCEKPLAMNAREAKAMYEKAEASRLKHMVTFTHRYAPWHRYLKQLVDEGYLGRPFQCNIRFLSPLAFWFGNEWRYNRQRGNGILGDLGSHMFDLARWFCGDILRVSAHLGIYAEHAGREGEVFEPANDAISLLLEFANGAQGLIQVSGVALNGSRVREVHVALHGECGTLEVDEDSARGMKMQGMKQGEDEFQELAVPDELWGDVNRDQPPVGSIYEVCLKQPIGDRLFIDAVLDDLPVSPTFYDGLKAQEIMDAAIISDREGRKVTVPVDDEGRK